VLWLPGRNEAFYHPHVSDMFDAHGWTVYVLSYRRMGVCRRLHLFGNPMHNSHSDGDFGEYHEDIRQAILLLRNHGATEILGYGHSTGATVSVMNEVIAVHRR
jgi:alpha-beta hydrolase superfamily lysophospholipase